MDLAAVFTGIGAILTAAGGTALVVREFRRRERKECDKEIEELSTELHAVRQRVIRLEQWAYRVQRQASHVGIVIEETPE